MNFEHVYLKIPNYYIGCRISTDWVDRIWSKSIKKKPGRTMFGGSELGADMAQWTED